MTHEQNKMIDLSDSDRLVSKQHHLSLIPISYGNSWVGCLFVQRS